MKDEFEIYRSLVENSGDLLYRTNNEGRIIYISPSVKMLSGYSVEEAIGMDMAKDVYLHPKKRLMFLEQLQKKGRVYDFEARLKKKDGSIWWASTNAWFYTDENKNICGVEGITRDITKLKETVKALHESEERFRLAFDTSPDAINLNRLSDGLYIDINQGFTELTGYTIDDIRNKTSLEIKIWNNPEDRQLLVKSLSETGHVRNLEARFLKKNGDIITGLMSARVLKINGEDIILSITREITELKKAQEIILQSEKMKTLGGLSAGMAHEINNPLAGMVQSAEVLYRRLSNTSMASNLKVAEDVELEIERLRKYMEKRKILQLALSIKKAGMRIARIVQNMLGFARENNDLLSLKSMPELVDQTIDLAKTDFNLKKQYDFKKITIVRNYQKDLPKIPCDPTKLQQVFFNVLKNGAHAMQEAGTKNACFSIFIGYEPDRRLLCIEISDNGPGMTSEVKERIFEPFFTTKPPGSGTGLGMSVAYFIITQFHKGELEVDSKEQYGTRFTIRLPVLADTGKSRMLL